MLAKVEDGGGKHGARMAKGHTIDQMLQRPDTATGDHRNIHHVGNRTGQRKIISGTRSVSIHGGDEQFACAKSRHAAGMFQRINAGRAAATMGEDLPARLTLCSHAARVDRSNNALAAKPIRDLADHLGPGNGSAVHRHFVRPGEQERTRILRRADAAAYRQRHEADFRRARHDIQQRATPFMTGRNIEKAKLIGAGRVIDRRLLDRIARVTQADEIDAFHHAPVGDIEARDDAGADGHSSEPAGPPLLNSRLPPPAGKSKARSVDGHVPDKQNSPASDIRMDIRHAANFCANRLALCPFSSILRRLNRYSISVSPRLRFGNGWALEHFPMLGSWPVIILSALLVLLLLRAAQTDIQSRIISNSLNLAIALLAPAWWWANGLAPYPGVALQLGLALGVFALFTAMFALGMMGGGDVKLLTALALWMPLPAMTSLLIVMAAAGGGVTLATIIHHRLAKRTGRPEIPYGVAIAIAGIWVVGARYLNHWA